jgi:hypothetical protein
VNWSMRLNRASSAFKVNSVVLVPFIVRAGHMKHHFFFVQNSPKGTPSMLKYPAARLSPRKPQSQSPLIV